MPPSVVMNGHCNSYSVISPSYPYWHDAIKDTPVTQWFCLFKDKSNIPVSR